MIRAAALAGALAACADTTEVVSPVIDVPVNDDASAFPLDEITIAVAHQGAADNIASATFTKGATVELGGVPFADDLVLHLTGRVGTSEVAYGRTCMFPVVANSAIPTPHLFFSRSVKFGQLAYQPERRLGGTAITYHDGSGLVIGGVDPDTNLPLVDVERLDPSTGEYRPLTNVEPRTGAVVTTLGIGSDEQIAVIGGRDPNTGVGAAFVELIEAENPPTRRVERIDDSLMARVGLTATPLTDGRVMAIGGTPPGMPPSAAVDEISLSSGSPVVRELRAMLGHARTDHTATRLGNDVGAPLLVAGGVNAAGVPIAQAELFKPLSEDFSSTFNATLVYPRSQHQAVRMPDGSVLIIGGIDKDGNPVPTLELFTLDAGFVALTPDLPLSAGLVDFAATTLADGRVLITGGRQAMGAPPVKTAFIARLDPKTGQVDVVATDQLATERAGHQATLLCDGTVLVSGGTAMQVPAERYNPPGSDLAFGRR